MTLRRRLTIVLVAVVAIGAVLFGLVARAMVERQLAGDVDRDLRAEVTRVARDLQRPRPFGGRVGGRRPGALFGRQSPFAQVLGGDGSIVARTTGVEAIGGLPDPDVDASSAGELQLRTVRIDGERYRLGELAARDGSVVQVARPLSELSAFLDRLRWVLLAAGALGVGAAVLLGPWAARATLRPVHSMTRTTRRIADSPREIARARVEPAFPDPELREFADAVNGMLDALDAADRNQRRFVADASHELRTPLTSLGGNAEYLQRAAELDDDQRDALDAVGRDVQRLVRIADGLTMLARLDATPVTQLEPVDVDAQLTESVARFERVHRDHRVSSTTDAGTHLLDVELVRRVLDNLLDNAGRYTPAGSSVHVEASTEGECVVIVVADDGPGLGEHEREQVLERFHRGSTSAGVSGTGLGLAIVDEAARSLGGSLRLSAARPDGTGLRCIVRLRSAGHPDG